jgi:hypothetical protein
MAYMPVRLCSKFNKRRELYYLWRLPDRVMDFGIKRNLIHRVFHCLKYFFIDYGLRERYKEYRGSTTGTRTKRGAGFCIMAMLTVVSTG